MNIPLKLESKTDATPAALGLGIYTVYTFVLKIQMPCGKSGNVHF